MKPWRAEDELMKLRRAESESMKPGASKLLPDTAP
jgi:hypothetical protein